MAVKIRLTRIGKKNDPKYRIIVIEEGKKRDGRYVDKIGFYDPMKNPPLIKIDVEKYQKWLTCGAKLSEGLLKLFKRKKVGQNAGNN